MGPVGSVVGYMFAYSPPTSEVGGSNAEPYLGKLIVAYRWLAVYSKQP